MSATATLDQKAVCNQAAENIGKTFPWHQIYAASETASIDFYTKAFGWGTHDFDMGPCGTYKMLTANGLPVAGVVGTKDSSMNAPEDAPCQMADTPPHWSVSVAVENIDSSVDTIRSLGGTLLDGPMDIPSVGRIALIQDPQGAALWIFQPA